MFNKGFAAIVGATTLIFVVAQFIFVVFFITTGIAAQEPVSCDAEGGIPNFGFELIADRCVPKFMTDWTQLHYINNNLSCNKGATVNLFAANGDEATTPRDFSDKALALTATDGRKYRIFRNREGSHFLLVHPDYTGTIDGKRMTDYAEGQIHTDVFASGFVLPQTPSCEKEFDRCETELPASSTVNMGSGRLSHSQELFSTKGGPLPIHLFLSYRSMPFAPSTIGSGWSHSFETSLQFGDNGDVTLWDEGKTREYRLIAGVYKAAAGDHAYLSRDGDGGGYLHTELNGLKRRFDASGRIVSTSDRNGNTMLFAYTDGRLSSVTDPSGRSAVFAYDANGNLSTVTDPRDNRYAFTYSGGFLTTVTNPDGGTWRYTYAGNGSLQTKTDPGGNVASYSYDSNRRVISTADPRGNSRSYGFGGAPRAPGKVPDVFPPCYNTLSVGPDKQLIVSSHGACTAETTALTEKNSGQWRYDYDYTSGTLKSQTDPYNNTTSYTHDKDGNVLTKTEPGIGTTWYSYDSDGNTTSVKDPLGNTTAYTYNSFGQILTTSGPGGSTSNSYDPKGNLTSSTDAAGATTMFEYDGKGNLVKVTNAKNQATVLTYTAAGQVETITDPAGIVARYTYDAGGNMLTLSDPSGSTTYAYDSMNRAVSITDPFGNVTTYVYDRQGNRISATDANGNTTSYKHNYQGQVTEAKDALDGKTVYSYGASSCPSCSSGVDKLTALTDAKQQTTGYEYDLVSRLINETDPLGNATHYAYDTAGNLVSRTDANGATVAYSYDALRRLTEKSYPDNSRESYSYDAAGRMITATNKDISYTYTYDAAGRLANVSDSRGFTIAYENDMLGSRTKTTFQPGMADQHITTYTYDTANRPKTITSNAGTFTYSYDTLGRRGGTAYPNGVSASYRYDSVGRLTNIAHAAGATTIAFANYSGFDKVGNRKSKVTGQGTESYGYDPLYRLTQAGTARGTENYSYDAVGNRLTGPGPKDIRYQYNAGNQMITGRIMSYLYDHNGNQAARTLPGSTAKSWTQTWDHENRLVGMEMQKGAEKRTVSFKYDPLGRRIEKKLVTSYGGETRTSTWIYVHDGDDVAVEIHTDAGGAVSRTYYTHGAGTDEHLAMERGGNSYYFHADGLGSVAVITDVNREVVQSYEYEPFGLVTPSSAFKSSYTYTGREWDKETGLYYYGNRYYDPMEGRFISKDPISFAGGDVNLYGYVKNNPLNWVDPDGLDPKPTPNFKPPTNPPPTPTSRSASRLESASDAANVTVP